MVRVIGIGAGGHARVVVEALAAAGGCEIAGFLDSRRESWGTSFCGYPVLGGDELLGDLLAQDIRHFFLGVGSVADSSHRRELYLKAVSHGLEPVTVIHPAATVSSSARLGRGIVVLAGAVINANASIGENVIVNTGAVIEHDCVVGDHVHVATRAALAGGVHVSSNVHVGAGAIVCQSLSIGRSAIVGAGAVVIRDVPECAIVVGVPAKPIKECGPR